MAKTTSLIAISMVCIIVSSDLHMLTNYLFQKRLVAQYRQVQRVALRPLWANCLLPYHYTVLVLAVLVQHHALPPVAILHLSPAALLPLL